MNGKPNAALQHDLDPCPQEVFGTSSCVAVKEPRRSRGCPKLCDKRVESGSLVTNCATDQLERAVEDGMAQGVSNLSILHRMDSPDASIISMGPWQLSRHFSMNKALR